MKINVYPQSGIAGALPGALGLFYKSDKYAVGISSIPGVVDLVNKSVKCSVENPSFKNFYIFNSLNPINLGGFRNLVNTMKLPKEDKGQNYVFSPEPYRGWLQAMIREWDYSSTELKDFEIFSYDVERAECFFDLGGFSVESADERTGFFDNVLKFRFEGSAFQFYYCDAVDILQPFPLNMVGAELCVVNLSRYPYINCGSDQNMNIFDAIINRLGKHGIKTAIFPSSDGILLTIPESNPAYREYISEDSYSLDMFGVDITVLHEKKFSHLKYSIPTVLVEDEESHKSILLGIDLATTLHQRVGEKGKTNYSSIVLPANSYRKVISCIDMYEQHFDNPPRIICGNDLSNAISYLRNQILTCYPRAAQSEVSILPSSDEKSSMHVLHEWLEVLMIPYPGKGDSYIARIRDIHTEEYLIFTETVEDLKFLKMNLAGIDTFVVGVALVYEEMLKKYIVELKDLQKEYKVQRLIVLYSGGTVVSDLNI